MYLNRPKMIFDGIHGHIAEAGLRLDANYGGIDAFGAAIGPIDPVLGDTIHTLVLVILIASRVLDDLLVQHRQPAFNLETVTGTESDPLQFTGRLHVHGFSLLRQHYSTRCTGKHFGEPNRISSADQIIKITNNANHFTSKL